MGKIYGVNTTNFSGLKNAFSQLCAKELKVIKLAFNFYQFIFTKKEEKTREGMVKKITRVS